MEIPAPPPAAAHHQPAAAAHVSHGAPAAAERAPSLHTLPSPTAAAAPVRVKPMAVPSLVRVTRPRVTWRVPLVEVHLLPLLLLLLCVLQGPRAALAAPPRDLSNFQSRHACPVGSLPRTPRPFACRMYHRLCTRSPERPPVHHGRAPPCTRRPLSIRA